MIVEKEQIVNGLPTPISKARAEEQEAPGSVRQSAADKRWKAGTPATPEQIAEIANCPPHLAKAMAANRWAPRLDGSFRHGKAALLWPYYARRAGCLDLSALYLHTRNQSAEDYLGARENAVTTRIQEAATLFIPGNPNAPGKSRRMVVLAASPLDAMAVHEASPGADVYGIGTPNIPQWLIHRWIHLKKTLLVTVGLSASETQIIQAHAQQAGWYGMIRRAKTLAVVLPEPDGDDDVSASGHTDRITAWSILTTQGMDALKAFIQDSAMVYDPRIKGTTVTHPAPGDDRDGNGEQVAEDVTDECPAPQATIGHGNSRGARQKARALFRAARKTGRTRSDRDGWFSSLDDASDYLNTCLDDGARQHVAAMEAITGLGKTHAILALMLRDDRPHIMVTPTVELAQEAYRKILALASDDVKADIRLHIPRSEDTCQRYPTIQLLQTASRGPFAQVCKMSDVQQSIPGDCEHYETCPYMAGLKLDKQARILIAPHAALSGESSMLKQAGQPIRDSETGQWETPEETPRRIVVDEQTEAATLINLTHEDTKKNILALSHWNKKQTWVRDRMRGAMGDQFTEEKLQAGVDAYGKFSAALNTMYTEFSWWADPNLSRKPIAIRQSGVWRDLVDAYRKLPDALTLMDGSTLAERPVMPGRNEENIIPKQWLAALVQALKDGMIWIHNGNLVIGKEGGLWKNLMKQGGFYLDATIGLTQRQIILNTADSGVHTVAVHQPNLRVLQMLDGRQHGKASLAANGIGNELKLCVGDWRRLVIQYGHGQVAGILHKVMHNILMLAYGGDADDRTIPDADLIRAGDALERWGLTPGGKEWLSMLQSAGIPPNPRLAREAAGFTMEDVTMLGHWHKDDRGHNLWEKAKALFCWGAPLLTPDEYLIRYSVHRVIMKRHGVDLPEWDGSVTKGQAIETNGGEHTVTTQFPLPTLPEARAFVLDSVNAQIAQAVGRLRGVRRTAENPAQVFLFMGDFPVAAVGHDHMIPTIEYLTDLDSYQAVSTTKEVMAIQAIADTPPDQRVVAEAIREAVNGIYGFDPGSRLGRRVAMRIMRQVEEHAHQHRISIQAAATALVHEIARFIPDPRSFPEAAGHYLERLQDRNRWNRMYMGTGPWAKATLALLDMLYEATFTPREPEDAPPG